jgi:hypothetical protein
MCVCAFFAGDGGDEMRCDGGGILYGLWVLGEGVIDGWMYG